MVLKDIFLMSTPAWPFIQLHELVFCINEIVYSDIIKGPGEELQECKFSSFILQ